MVDCHAMQASIEEIMRETSPEQGSLLAAAVTDWVNRRMSRQDAVSCNVGVNALLWNRCQKIMEGADANLNTLNLGWKAYRAVHLPELQGVKGFIENSQLVSSLPPDLRNKMSGTANETGILDGSVLEQIAELISEAKSFVQIVNPYWSEYGIEPILRRLELDRGKQINVEILTKKNMEVSDRRALKNLCSHLRNYGMSVSVKYLDCDNGYGHDSLLHAKTIVVDRRKAYLGSANLTGNGMNLSVELGIIFEGLWAKRLSEWLELLGDQLITMDEI